MFGFGQKKKPIWLEMAVNSSAGWGSGHGGGGTQPPVPKESGQRALPSPACDLVSVETPELQDMGHPVCPLSLPSLTSFMVLLGLPVG